MYPYNYDTKSHNKNNISVRETKEVTLSELAKDKKFLDLLDLAMKESNEMEQRYNRLCHAYPNLTAASSILKTMMLDEQKDKNRLMEIYFTITQKNMTPKSKDTKAQTTEEMDAEKYLEQTLLKELDLVNFYRNLLLAVPACELRDLFFEIFTDTQSHIGALNYVYNKYFR